MKTPVGQTFNTFSMTCLLLPEMHHSSALA